MRYNLYWLKNKKEDLKREFGIRTILDCQTTNYSGYKVLDTPTFNRMISDDFNKKKLIGEQYSYSIYNGKLQFQIHQYDVSEPKHETIITFLEKERSLSCEEIQVITTDPNEFDSMDGTISFGILESYSREMIEEDETLKIPLLQSMNNLQYAIEILKHQSFSEKEEKEKTKFFTK